MVGTPVFSDRTEFSVFTGGKNPYWGQQLMRRDIRPVAEKLGITKRIGWHTFRHHIASGRGSGSESNAGTAATLHDPCDLGYLHPGGDSRQAYSPHRGSLADCWKWRIEAVYGTKGSDQPPEAGVELKNCYRGVVRGI
jgi:hypothetical protein